MSSDMRERVRVLLEQEKCSGWQCKGWRAKFTQRIIAGNVAIHLQCLMCGRSVGVLKRAEVYNWQDLPKWDSDISDRFGEAIRRDNIAHIQDIEGAQQAREQEAAPRRIEYRQWLLTSPEWKTLRDRVWRRAMGDCEACLANRATDVHHVTYRLGRLPPAWELRAVCRQCHDRLHNWTGGEE